MTIAERYHSVLERVAAAAARSGRNPGAVTIVAAAKTFGPEEIRALLAAGAHDIGENFVQEARRKRAAIAMPDVRWHLIGRLQRNKARPAVTLFDRIHSLDSLELASSLDRAAAAKGTTIRCLLEVNLAGERTKGGVSPEAIPALLEGLGVFSSLSVDGLMTIPPPAERAEDSRRFFARLREIRDELSRLRLPGVRLKELSMGMSSDFEVAVEEGATFVRVGTAIFGRRSARR